MYFPLVGFPLFFFYFFADDDGVDLWVLAQFEEVVEEGGHYSVDYFFDGAFIFGGF